MNEQGSEICFEEASTIHPDQTAKSLFSRLAHGCAYADQLLDGLATGYLIALIESVCIREMLRHMDATTEIIVGRAINIQHCAPAAPGKRVWLRGMYRTLHALQQVHAHQVDQALFAVNLPEDAFAATNGDTVLRVVLGLLRRQDVAQRRIGAEVEAPDVGVDVADGREEAGRIHVGLDVDGTQALGELAGLGRAVVLLNVLARTCDGQQVQQAEVVKPSMSIKRAGRRFVSSSCCQRLNWPCARRTVLAVAARFRARRPAPARQ